ncbi:MAG TPA: S8/S53 family peptidase [Candidatus Thermoplasmatota archaeon]|nr:S8/S53 family peptidase [Candidatus Thermoplasmatota archaeon]
MRRLAALLALAVAFAGCAAPAEDALAPADAGADALAGARVVIAHVDTGINPYSLAFRDESPLAWVHPSRYLPGYPEDAPALRLSLNETDYAKAYEADKAVWDSVERDRLYWIPGTRIVGAVSFGPGGTNCPPAATPPLSYVPGDCADRPILDDHGHGTMTASRMASREGSLAPDARIVTVEGPGAHAVRWLADQGWIDAQTNSWLDFVPPPASDAVDGISEAFAHAASRMAVFAASGNGAGYVLGFAPTPTYVLDTAAPGVVLVGAHDNGRVAPWSGAPAHVLADGFGGLSAAVDSVDAFGPTPVSCCTSAASPYAAGGAAAMILAAREILGDPLTGVRDGVLAQGPEGLVAGGPLADGDLTLDELRDLVTKTATARPAQGPHDGDMHWGSQGAPPSPTNPAGNPYCLGCWGTPIAFSQVPEGVPLVAHAGYGSVDPLSLDLALQVLRGEMPLPERATEDAFFALDAQARAAIFGSL